MRISHKFLKDVINDFHQNEPKNIGKFLKQHVQQASDLSNDKITTIHKKATKLQTDMMNTIDHTLTRGDDVEILDDDAHILMQNSTETFRRARTIKRQLYFRMMITIAILVFMLLACFGIIGVLIFLLICVFPATKVGCFGENTA